MVACDLIGVLLVGYVWVCFERWLMLCMALCCCFVFGFVFAWFGCLDLLRLGGL